MSWSLGEIAVLAVKAARGSGLSWGLADEAGWAVRWLCERGHPGPEALASLLNGQSGASGLAIGVALSDGASVEDDFHETFVAAPLLSLPFMSLCATDQRYVLAEVAGHRVHVGPNGTDLNVSLSPTAPVRFSWSQPVEIAAPSQGRVKDIAPHVLTTLQEFAARTYAPPTQASREQGAGAGLHDTD